MTSIDFRTEEQKDKASIIDKYKRGLHNLRSSMREISHYTQLIRGEVHTVLSANNLNDFTKCVYLLAERNLSMIHIYKFSPMGDVIRVSSQMIGTVDKIYYKN